MNILTHHAKNGFEPDEYAATTNTIEFRLRENNSGRYPRGLSWMLKVIKNWMYVRFVA